MIEILVVHSSDYGNEIHVYVDGELVSPGDDLYIVEVDPGAGWTYEDWQESAKAAFERGTWPKFRTAVYGAYADPPSREYITGWPEEEE